MIFFAELPFMYILNNVISQAIVKKKRTEEPHQEETMQDEIESQDKEVDYNYHENSSSAVLKESVLSSSSRIEGTIKEDHSSQSG